MPRQESEPTHAKVWLNALLNTYPQNHRGGLYEGRVVEACNILKEKGAIEDFQLSPKHSSADNSGVDVVIRGGGILLNIQVTSVPSRIIEHKKVHNRNPNRPPVDYIGVREGNRHTIKPIHKLQREILKKLAKKARSASSLNDNGA
jgi:hypothetical protein